MRELDDLEYEPSITNGAVPGAEADSEQEIRLTTLADLSMLLLTFFVALYALSDQDQARFDAYMTSIREHLAAEPPGTASGATGAGGFEKPGNPLADRGARMDRLLERENLLREQRKVYDNARTFAERPVFAGRMVVDFEDGAVVLRLPSSALFDEPASAARRPSAQGRALLAEIKDFLATHADQTANVRDHADPQDNADGQDAAWEASAVRAAGVLRVLVDLGVESRRLTATGLAAEEPLLPGVSPEQRGRNRRVEITLEKRSRR